MGYLGASGKPAGLHTSWGFEERGNSSVRKHLLGLLTLFALMASLLGPVSAQAAPSIQSDGISPMIVGGVPATQQYGAVSGQTAAGRHRCGGVLIKPDVLVTAAHCITFGAYVPGGMVRAGSKDRTQGGELIEVVGVEAKPSFDPNKPGSDIGLVYLKRPVADASLVIPIARRTGPVWSDTRIAGWGKQCENPANPLCATLPTQLQQLDTKIVPDSRCLQYVPEFGRVFDPRDELCMAAANRQHAMACNGDSGGPMVRLVWHHGRWVWALIAVTSRDGDDFYTQEGRYDYCASGPTGRPGVGVYTSVIAHLDWIKARIAARSLTAQSVAGPMVQDEFELVG